MSVHPLAGLQQDFATFAAADASRGAASMVDSAPFAAYLDAQDPLAANRRLFHFPKRTAVASAHSGSAGSPAAADGGDAPSADEPFVYLVGNSLGLQHVGVEASVAQELMKWREQAVEGHFLQPNPWFEIDNVCRKDMAAIVGAEEGEVVLMNTLTCNLHLLLTAFYKPSGRRTKIMAESFPFPSDTHAFVSQARLHGLDPDEHYINVTSGTATGGTGPEYIPTARWLEMIAAHGDETAVIVVGAVHFLTGQLVDMQAITAAAHAKGIVVGVDAAHAVGNVPLQLHDWGVDFACWCTYKYLNGGPGNIGGAFVHARHTPAEEDDAAADAAVATAAGPTPLRGWWGHARGTRFALHRRFVPADGAAAFQLSNPCVLSVASLVPSLRLFGQLTMPVLRAKSLRLTAYMEHLVLARLQGKVVLLTPAAPEERGAQLSIQILPGMLRSSEAASAAYVCGNDLGNDADLVQRQLLAAGVMCDNRPPDIIRVAAAPTYNSFTDVFQFVSIFASLFKP